MKNLPYDFNPGAKNETRYQSGFQRFVVIWFVSIWESLSGIKNNGLYLFYILKSISPLPPASYLLFHIHSPAYCEVKNIKASCH